MSRRAREALASAGHHPRVICGDGAAGLAQAAPYDRIISTVALPRVPDAWLEQTREGALILIPLIFAGHGGMMALLTRDANSGASGRFLSQYGGFMAVRDAPAPRPATIRPQLLETSRPTDVPPEALSDGHPAAFYLSLRTWPYKIIRFTPDDGNTGLQTWGRSIDGSTFALVRTEDTTNVTASGPLWAALDTAYAEWHELGRPQRDRFGLTVGEQQWVWLDNPDNAVVELGSQR
jgi:hypothetical protein